MVNAFLRLRNVLGAQIRILKKADIKPGATYRRSLTGAVRG